MLSVWTPAHSDSRNLGWRAVAGDLAPDGAGDRFHHLLDHTLHRRLLASDLGLHENLAGVRPLALRAGPAALLAAVVLPAAEDLPATLAEAEGILLGGIDDLLHLLLLRHEFADLADDLLGASFL